jgi:hypothetical protein
MVAAEVSATEHCSCGRPVTRVEVRIVKRCSRGHFVTSDVATAAGLLERASRPEPQTPGQQRAFHAKCNAIDKRDGLTLGETKKRLLAELGLDSSSQLDSDQMTDVLNRLEADLSR